MTLSTKHFTSYQAVDVHLKYYPKPAVRNSNFENFNSVKNLDACKINIADLLTANAHKT